MVPFIRLFASYHPLAWLNNLTIFERIDAIATGCIFALNKEWILSKLNRHWNVIFFGSFLALISWMTIGSLSFAHKWHLGFLFVPLGVEDGTVVNIAIAFIMMYSVFGPQKHWHKFLNLRWMNFIGILSYSIYLWQQFFLHNTGAWYNSLPINLLCIAMASCFSYYIIERPFLKLKSKFSGEKKKQAAGLNDLKTVTAITFTTAQEHN